MIFITLCVIIFFISPSISQHKTDSLNSSTCRNLFGDLQNDFPKERNGYFMIMSCLHDLIIFQIRHNASIVHIVKYIVFRSISRNTLLFGNYTVLHIFAQVLFWAENQGNHKNWIPFIQPYNFWLTYPWKSVKIYRVEWMGLNFDDYPGF